MLRPIEIKIKSKKNTVSLYRPEVTSNRAP